MPAPTTRAATFLHALAAIGLGLTALVWRDLPMIPQRLPAGLPRLSLGLLCGALLLAGGAAVLAARARRAALAGLAVFYAAYALLMAGPTVAEHRSASARGSASPRSVASRQAGPCCSVRPPIARDWRGPCRSRSGSRRFEGPSRK